MVKIMVRWARFASPKRHSYEVSSAGDSRYSAFNAYLPDGRSIEMHYQCDIKGYDVGGRNWRLGKGKPPLQPQSEDELWTKYLGLWRTWAEHNPVTMAQLRAAVESNYYTLTDCFASTPINQARALATLLNEIPDECQGNVSWII